MTIHSTVVKKAGPVGNSDAGARRSDNLRFLRSWVAHPLRTAAIRPSSSALAELMTRMIVPTAEHVVELGPGTGVFTTALLKRGLSARQLTLMESDPRFVELLQQRFPGADIVHGDAAAGPWELLHKGRVDAVVSGLPLLSMPAARVSAVLSAAFTRLAPQGEFLQFTYAGKLPVRTAVMTGLGLEATLIGRTFRNLPPASVYRISRLSGGGSVPADKLGILKPRVSGEPDRFRNVINDQPAETGAWRGDVQRPDA
ncbi:class I SAM-dependent methyltransferase [Mycolicibacterium iranicum]|uniref:class I SAM-dependent methyltransferase n=1 Tax=Mycolicibacterium iranicum TaxID=912594 RepID=UPI0007D8E389|nr:methyltransferase domain-containing protein [Mycolicibacterium iranicum]